MIERVLDRAGRVVRPRRLPHRRGGPRLATRRSTCSASATSRCSRASTRPGSSPDEVNWVPGRDPEDRTRQICNGWRADNVIAAQVLSERTGRLGAQLAGYRGTRILQDNVLWKPPGTKAIGFHQDSSYADYLVPAEMLTCWISLHETTADAGPIEYVRGSHLWPKSPPERSQFHAPDDWLAPAAERGTRRHRARDRPRRRQAGRRLVPPRPHLARLGTEHERGRRAHGARHALAPGRGALPRDERRPDLLALHAATATSRSTSRSSRCCGTRRGTARPGSRRCRRSTDDSTGRRGSPRGAAEASLESAASPRCPHPSP